MRRLIILVMLALAAWALWGLVHAEAKLVLVYLWAVLVLVAGACGYVWLEGARK